MSKQKYSPRYVSRLMAIQALYGQEQTGDSIESIVSDFITSNFKKEGVAPGMPTPDEALFKHLVLGTASKIKELDPIIEKHIERDWGTERLSIVMRNLLRLSTFEIIHELLTPSPVLLDQYIEIAKEFFPQSDVSFVNGLLNNIAREVRHHQANDSRRPTQ